MSEEFKEPKNASEMQDKDLEGAQGGAGYYTAGAKIHRGCGGVIEDMGTFFGIETYRYICRKCEKETHTLDEFDFYLYGMGNPFNTGGGI